MWIPTVRVGAFNSVYLRRSASQALPYTLWLRDKISIWYRLVTHIAADAML